MVALGCSHPRLVISCIGCHKYESGYLPPLSFLKEFLPIDKFDPTTDIISPKGNCAHKHARWSKHRGSELTPLLHFPVDKIHLRCGFHQDV